MTQFISATGLEIDVTASNTFPNGFTVTSFADDADPFDLPEIQIADSAMNLNGELVAWSMANPIEFTINVIPDSIDDQNLAILFEANRVGLGKQSAQDIIQVVGSYPDGRRVTLKNGIIQNGQIASGVAQAGRKKSKSYQFRFENRG